LRARVPSEVATETLQCRRSYSQAVEPGIKLPLRNFEPVSAHQTLVGRFNIEKTDGSIPGRVRHFCLAQTALMALARAMRLFLHVSFSRQITNVRRLHQGDCSFGRSAVC
jgi:hypothetical protein